MKLAICAGPATTGKSSVLRHMIRKLLDSGDRVAFLKVDVQFAEEDEIFAKEFGIPTKKVYSGELCPDHCNVMVLGDAIQWAQRGEQLGAGELVVNSIDADGTRQGYELRLTRLVAEAVGVPVVASGGGGKPADLYDVLTEGKADAALVASMFHYNEYSVAEVKTYLTGRGLKIRMV